MKKIFLICLLFGMAIMSFAQNSNLKSKIVEEGTAIVVEGAVVAINGTSLAETTNKGGEFIIKNIPLGEQIVTVTKKGYETKIFILNIEKGLIFKVDKIEFTVTKKLKKARKKLRKEHEKEQDERLKKVKKETAKSEKEKKKLEKELVKQKEKELKELAKERKKREKEIKALAKNNNSDVKIDYKSVVKQIDTQTASTSPNDVDVNIVKPLSETQLKYAKILGIDASNIANTMLYEFIDKWTGTNYLNGGETKDGIDCSSFTQRLFTKVYDNYIERTAEKQFNSRFTDKFSDRTALKEGDLLFFKSFSDPTKISHVGIYLQNDRFVHSTSSRAKSGLNGVQISNLAEPKWAQRFVAGGRRLSSGN